MSAETAGLTIGLQLCAVVVVTFGRIKWAQPATVVARDTRTGAVRPRQQL
jgi:hypothetical protein